MPKGLRALTIRHRNASYLRAALHRSNPATCWDGLDNLKIWLVSFETLSLSVEQFQTRWLMRSQLESEKQTSSRRSIRILKLCHRSTTSAIGHLRTGRYRGVRTVELERGIMVARSRSSLSPSASLIALRKDTSARREYPERVECRTTCGRAVRSVTGKKVRSGSWPRDHGRSIVLRLVFGDDVSWRSLR